MPVLQHWWFDVSEAAETEGATTVGRNLMMLLL
jgi:hypothetical protein